MGSVLPPDVIVPSAFETVGHIGIAELAYPFILAALSPAVR